METEDNIFEIGSIFENGQIVGHKEVTIKVSVSVPNEFGIFKIITQFGDESPVERYISIKNEKIVKNTR